MKLLFKTALSSFLLQVTLQTGRIAGMQQRFLERDAALEIQISQGLVHGNHTLAGAGLHGAHNLFGLGITD